MNERLTAQLKIADANKARLGFRVEGLGFRGGSKLL